MADEEIGVFDSGVTVLNCLSVEIRLSLSSMDSD